MVVEQSVKSAAADGETVAALPMLPAGTERCVKAVWNRKEYDADDKI